MRVKHIYLCP